MQKIIVCAALLLSMCTTTAYGARCLPDYDFDKYPKGQPGYNRQTHQPYWHATMNSYITSDGHIVVDRSRGETAPPLHWEYKSIRLSWPAYTGPYELKGYKLERTDYLYADNANASEVVIGETSATRPNHASSHKIWRVYWVGSMGQLSRWADVTILCGQVVSNSNSGMEVEFLTADMGPEPTPDVLPYPPERFETAPNWNPLVAEILEERRTGEYKDSDPGGDPKDSKDPEDPEDLEDLEDSEDLEDTDDPKSELMVPLFPHGAHAFLTPTVRVTNHGNEPGEVRIEAISDLGATAGRAVLMLGANETVGFNSRQLEGDEAKEELVSGTGPLKERFWRLALQSDLDIEVLSYLRTPDGFIVPMHESVPRCEAEVAGDTTGDTTGNEHPQYPAVYRLPFFNPGSNQVKVSILRVINPGNESAALSISGTDESGAMAAQPVLATVPAGTAININAAELETGMHDDIDSGALGDGFGKWRLRVESSADVTVLNLLSYASGHVVNLSAAECR